MNVVCPVGTNFVTIPENPCSLLNNDESTQTHIQCRVAITIHCTRKTYIEGFVESIPLRFIFDPRRKLLLSSNLRSRSLIGTVDCASTVPVRRRRERVQVLHHGPLGGWSGRVAPFPYELTDLPSPP